MNYVCIRIRSNVVSDVLGTENIIRQYKERYGSIEVIYTAIIEKIDSVDTIHNWITVLENIANGLGVSCHFIFHSTAQSLGINKHNVHYINTWAIVTYRHSLNKHRKRWYPENNKTLFLVGKPFKLNRIGLLYHFYKNNTLDYLDYTLHFPPTQQNRNIVRDFQLEGLSKDNDIHRLLCDLQRPSMDLDLEKQQMHTGFEFTGFPTNLRYYRNTCLSIVSENSFTQDRGTPYLTEKLFRCMVNHHPFILLGDYGINEYVESLGYKTYNKFFLPFTESIQSDTYKIIEWAAKSVKHFIDNKHNHVDEIRQITEHNFNVFMSSSEKELKQLLSMFPNLNLDDPELFGPL